MKYEIACASRRHCERSEAIQWEANGIFWIASSFLLAMTWVRLSGVQRRIFITAGQRSAACGKASPAFRAAHCPCIAESGCSARKAGSAM
ncbi:MAG: hypothetical protein LBU42_08550 [Prevotellaceae bacterium]|nr:hypothetical protein [Prevotellaceae bacterium]